MNKRLEQLYNEMIYREAEETSLERENQMKRIAHEIVCLLDPKKKDAEEQDLPKQTTD